MTREELRHVRFIQERFPALYYTIFGEVMALTHRETAEHGLRAVAEICLEVGKAIVLETPRGLPS